MPHRFAAGIMNVNETMCIKCLVKEARTCEALNKYYPHEASQHPADDCVWGAWLAQLVAHATLDLRVISLSPTLSTEII